MGSLCGKSNSLWGPLSHSELTSPVQFSGVRVTIFLITYFSGYMFVGVTSFQAWMRLTVDSWVVGNLNVQPLKRK
jgi:hypothetical protein